MKISRSVFLWLFPAVILSVGSSILEAQLSPAGSLVSIRGKIISIRRQELSLATPSGDVLVKMPDATPIEREVPVTLSDIAPGMYIAASAQKQPDGTFRASRVHIFAEDQRGFREGHRPQSSLPHSTMTNATIERVEEMAVQDVRGPLLTLKYKGGEIKVFMPPNTPIVRRVSGGQEMLKPGAEVVIQAIQATDGSISASRITVSAGGIRPQP